MAENNKSLQIIDSLLDENTSKTIENVKRKIIEYKDASLDLKKTEEERNNELRKAAQLQNALNQFQEEFKNQTQNLNQTIPTYTEGLQAASTALEGLSSGFKAAKNILNQFGVESEFVNQAMGKIQAAMSLVQSLTALSKSVKVVTGATRIFNTVLKANPIGLIATAIGLLIAYFGDLFQEIQSLIPGLDGLNGAFNTVMDVAKGIGSTITKFVLTPIRTLIKILKGDFKGAIQEVKNGYNIIGNFKEGYDKSQKEREEKEARERREKRIAETKEIIKEHEDRHGADWKYTQEGRELYAKYYEDLLEHYEKDSKEYKDALQQKKKYDQDYAKSQLDNAKDLLRLTEAREGADWKYTKEGKKAYEQYYNDLLELYEEGSKEYNNALIEKLNYERAYNQKQKELADERRASELKTKDDEKIQKQKDDAKKAELQAIKDGIEADKEKRRVAALEGQERLDYINAQIEANKKLRAIQEAVETKEGATMEEKIAAQQKLREAINEEIELQKEREQLEEAEKLRKKELAQLETDLESAKNPQQLTNQEKLDALKAEAKALMDLASDTTKSYAERKKALDDYNKKQKEIAASEKEIKEEQKKALQEKLDATKQALSATASLIGENTVAGKLMAVAAAIIDTYKAGTATLSATAGAGPWVSIPAMTAVIATGLSTVKNILATKVPGANDSSSASDANISLPSMPELQAPIQETHNNLDAQDEAFFNQSTRVYVVESDITDSQKRVKVAETESAF